MDLNKRVELLSERRQYFLGIREWGAASEQVADMFGAEMAHAIVHPVLYRFETTVRNLVGRPTIGMQAARDVQHNVFSD
jgi:hypothetical protein